MKIKKGYTLNEAMRQLEELEVPEWLTYLHSHIYECLPKDEAVNWIKDLLEVIPVGIRIPDSLRDRFQIFWLERQKTQIDCDKYGDRRQRRGQQQSQQQG